jgi:DNA-binding protein HU-beta
MAKKPLKKKAPAKKLAPKKAKPAAKAPAKKAAPAAAKGGDKLPKVRSASRPRSTSTPPSYTQTEFVENIRAFSGLNRRSEAKEMVEDIAAFLKDALKRGYKVPLMGLGKIYVRQSKARQGRNPATGATINIPARKRVRFTAAKALKEAVLK